MNYGFGGSEGTALLQTQLNWHPLPHWGLNLHLRYLATDYGDKGDMNQNDFDYKASEPSVGIGVHYTWRPMRTARTSLRPNAQPRLSAQPHMPDAGSGRTPVRRLSRWLVRVIALALAFVVLPGRAAPTEWGPIDLKSATVAPGTKLKFRFFAKQFFESGFLDTPLWAARGVKPGPTLCIISGIHGDEINSVEIARRSFQAVMPTRLAGTLIVVPEVNSLGFRNMNRYMIDRRDLNRAFPGTMRGSVTSQAARVLFERVVRRCDYLIDLHTGSNFRSNVAQIRVDSSNPKSLALAENFGVGVIIEGRGPAGSLRREAVKAGVAAIIYEAAPPYTFVREEIEAGTRGILNVMDYLGMYASNQARTRSKKLKGSSWIRVPTGGGGIFLTEVALGDAVEAGDLLGTIADPDTDSVYEVRAHRPGIVIGVAQPQVVLSGYGIFHIGTFE